MNVLTIASDYDENSLDKLDLITIISFFFVGRSNLVWTETTMRVHMEVIVISQGLEGLCRNKTVGITRKSILWVMIVML